MQDLIERDIRKKIESGLENFPALSILGSRQCGKSTLASMLLSNRKDMLYLDLERPSDRNKLSDPEAFFVLNKDSTICLDEIQRIPELFPVLRSVIDERKRNGQFLILGSASRDLIQQSSESLAGRISHLELTPFLLTEILKVFPRKKIFSLRKLWFRGGFPRSFLSRSDEASFEWRVEFIRTFLERDIPQLGFGVPALTMERFWKMCAHCHGQLLNASMLGSSLGVSHHTIRSYIELLTKTFLLRAMPPFEISLKKRTVKSPKIFIRDTGLLHALLNIETQNDLLAHPVYGASWEGFVIENILARIKPSVGFGFYRTAAGAEIDLVLERGRQKIALECKVSSSPNLTKGFWSALKDLEIQLAWVVAPVDEPYPIKENVTVSPLTHFVSEINKMGFTAY